MSSGPSGGGAGSGPTGPAGGGPGRPGRGFGAWLSTIARNIVIDHHKSMRHQREMLAGDIWEYSNPPAPEDGPEAVALATEDHTELLAALRRLDSGKQREALAMRYLADMTVQECSQRLGCDAGAVKALTYRGTQALRRAMVAEAS